jgi:hypothetical protein
MPTIFRVECTACNLGPEVVGAVAGMVITDRRGGGHTLPEGYLAVQLDSGELIRLPHPVEGLVLQRHGFTWTQAGNQGRLFRVTFQICSQCGLLHEERQIHDPRYGCGASFVVAAITIALCKLGIGLNWEFSLLTGYFAMLGVLALVVAVNRARWRKANQALKLPSCSGCGSPEFTTIPKAVGKALPCPHCTTHNVRCTIAGTS